MNTQTHEALKMAIEALERYGDNYGGTDGDFEALKACEEALEQPLTKDWKETIDERIAKDDKFKEALAQPAQAITEGSQLSNIKAGSQSEKPSPPPAPKHTCTYSRTINQEYPRKCIHCGEVEALEQPSQEPVAWMKNALDNARDVCKYLDHDMIKEAKAHTKFFWNDLDKIRDFDDIHPAPSWQGLSDDEIQAIRLKTLDAVATNYEAYRAIEQALKEKNT